MTAMSAKRKQWIVFAVVAVLSIAADQITKIWARASLPTWGHGSNLDGSCVIPGDIITRMCGGKPVTVVDGFWDWRLSMNPGSAFGLFSDHLSIARVFLTIVGLGAVVWIVVTLKRARADQMLLVWALALVAGGAIGNLIDRIYYSVVTDFILWHVKTHEWPVFNVADVVLVIGVGLMLIDMQKEGKHEKEVRKLAEEKLRKEPVVDELKE